MTREELIAALESAEAGSRELDAEIWLLVTPGATRKQSSYVHKASGRTCYIDETREASGRLILVPEYTTSIDTALSLVPEGWDWEVCRQGTAFLTGPGDDFGHCLEITGTGATAALALCVAALEARA